MTVPLSPPRPVRPPRVPVLVLAGALLLGAVCGSAATAQDRPVPPPPGTVVSTRADPPGRIGRLAETTGPTWLFSPSQGEWVTAPVNRPLTTGDRLATDAGSRATVRIGSTALRLDGGTELELVAVDDDHIRLQVHAGSLAVRLQAPEKAGELLVQTAEGRIAFDRAGRYRIDRRDATTHLTVWSGEARFEAPGAATMVYPRQRGEFWFDAREGRIVYSLTDARDDAFTAWVAGRDYQDARSAWSRYVSPEMTGAEDLDRWGRWEEHGEHGALWIPRDLPAGWAPYRTGEWVWIAPWGWTWVDAAPWGFAPFHYGRWVWWRDGWAWAPGRWVARPVYAPALVGWIGGAGASIGVTVGGGRPVGWFPLGPSEVFVPWYGVSPRYVQQVNVTHVTRIDDLTQIVTAPGAWVGRQPYQHRWREPAVTVVPEPQFGRGPVGVGSSRWIMEPSVRQAWGDPGRGSQVVPDPGVRPGWTPRPGLPVPQRPPGPPAGAPPPVGSMPWAGGMPPIGSPGDRLPPGAVERDRMLQIPERIVRPPAMPAVPAAPEPAGAVPSPPATVPGAVWSTAPSAVRPPSGVDDGSRRLGRPSGPPPGELRPPGPPPVWAPAAPVDDAARRIGRPPGPAMPSPAPTTLPPPAPMAMPPARPFARPEPPPGRPAEPVRVPGPDTFRDCDRRELAR